VSERSQPTSNPPTPARAADRPPATASPATPKVRPQPAAPAPAPAVEPTPAQRELEVLIRARYPLLYIVSWEE